MVYTALVLILCWRQIRFVENSALKKIVSLHQNPGTPARNTQINFCTSNYPTMGSGNSFFFVHSLFYEPQSY